MTTDYKELFKDPRWQKKRLEVLKRDQFCCCNCLDSTKELHVHHRYYEKGKKPWEYDMDALVTLCKKCHEEEKAIMDNAIEKLTTTMKALFFGNDILRFAWSLKYHTLYHVPEVFISALSDTVRHKSLQKKMLNNYFKFLEKRRLRREKKSNG